MAKMAGGKRSLFRIAQWGWLRKYVMAAMGVGRLEDPNNREWTILMSRARTARELMQDEKVEQFLIMTQEGGHYDEWWMRMAALGLEVEAEAEKARWERYNERMRLLGLGHKRCILCRQYGHLTNYWTPHVMTGVQRRFLERRAQAYWQVS
jgi:hypothetical protein